MLLIDTSIWIEFFNDGTSTCAQFLETVLLGHLPVCINAVIEMEILQGVREERAFKETKSYLESFQYFPEITSAYFDLSVEIYRECRKKGITVRRSLDCIIAANGLIDGLTIVHCDRDFDNIKKVYPKLGTIKIAR